MSYGNVIGDAIIGALLAGFAAGIVFVVGGWALWHYVLSHIDLVWR